MRNDATLPARSGSVRLTAVIAALLLLTATVFGVPVTAAAAARVQVSVDEKSFADRMPRPLFSGVDRLVPGDQLNDTFWVKNTSASPIDVTVALKWAGPAEPTTLDDILTIGMNDETQTVGQLRQTPLRAKLGELAPGQIARVNTAAHLPLEAQNPTQRQYLKLALVLQLSGEDEPSPEPTPSDDPTGQPTDQPTSSPEPSATTPPGDDGDDEGRGDDNRGGDRDDDSGLPLPRTGTEAIMLIFAGLIVMTIGITAIAATRRRRNSGE